jgi:hypothetical protein
VFDRVLLIVFSRRISFDRVLSPNPSEAVRLERRARPVPALAILVSGDAPFPEDLARPLRPPSPPCVTRVVAPVSAPACSFLLVYSCFCDGVDFSNYLVFFCFCCFIIVDLPFSLFFSLILLLLILISIS